MKTTTLTEYLHLFRLRMAHSVFADHDEQQLLDKFIRDRDEAAFATLVRRHGGLVYGVAARHLVDRHQAEDVFQATFLALARSAPRLGRPASLANWLYTVALRQARRLRARNRKPSACPAEQRDELAAFHLISLAVPLLGQSSCGPQ